MTELVDGRGLRVAVVACRGESAVAAELLGGALEALRGCGVAEPTVVRVADAFELPLVAKSLAALGHHAVVCVALVPRAAGWPAGDVCRAITDGCTQVALATGVPIGFGVLTDDPADPGGTAGPDGPSGSVSPDQRGAQAVLAALETALLLRDLRHGGRFEADRRSAR
jgi:6,7-dimethyl-8-ribityllumazine synthase